MQRFSRICTSCVVLRAACGGFVDEVEAVLLGTDGCGRGRTGLNDVDLYAIVRLEKLK